VSSAKLPPDHRGGDEQPSGKVSDPSVEPRAAEPNTAEANQTADEPNPIAPDSETSRSGLPRGPSFDRIAAESAAGKQPRKASPARVAVAPLTSNQKLRTWSKNSLATGRPANPLAARGTSGHQGVPIPPEEATRPTVAGAGAPAGSRSPPAPGTPGNRPQTGPGSSRAVPVSGDPYPPISSSRNLDELGDALMDQKRLIPPRSPLAALQPENVTVPTRRSKRARHPLVIVGNAVITLLVLFLVAGGVMLFIGKQRFDEPGPLAEDKVVNIPSGHGIRDIADLLQRQGVIGPDGTQKAVFVGGVYAMRANSKLKHGEYRFAKAASMHDVVDTIMSGKVVQHIATIPEGLTSEQVVARLMGNDVLTGNVREIPREGSLLPESYKFVRGTTREDMLKRMQEAQRRALAEIWERRTPGLPIQTPEQLVILASIIEKETGKPEERTRVAAVFINRLKQRMRLQSDPTIIYGLVGGKGTLGRPLSRADVAQPTSYNTYVIDGLPPGPIANPGRASLEAAANPARTRELYFVADGTGGHAFSTSYDQHLKNVARLRGIERDRRNNSGDGGAATTGLSSGPAAGSGTSQ